MKLSRIDLNLLVVLDAVIQTRSVGKAAQQVGLSKPAMSHALARLRKQMGDRVLVRSGKEWMLTSRASGLADRVHELTRGARGVLGAELAFEPKSATQEFRVHATDHVLSLLGVELGETLTRAAPSVVLRFLPILPDDVAALRDHVDLAIGVFPALPPEFRTQLLFEDRFVCAVRIGHPTVRGRLTLKCFLEMKHLLVSPRGLPGSTVDDALQRRGLSRRLVRYVPYFMTALDFVSRTDCVVTISERLAAAHAARFGLQLLSPPLTLPPYSIRQVWHPRVDSDPAHVWFRKQVVVSAASHRRQRPKSSA